MNLKILLFSCVLSCSVFIMQAQTLSNKVVASGGSYSTASWGSLSATVGEAAITRLSSTNVSLLQGFQQPTSGLAGITASKNSALISSVYPNPASSQVFLEINLPNTTNISYKIFDMSGKELLSGNFTAEAFQTSVKKLDMADLSNGMYLISLFAGSESIQNTKIQIIH